MGSFDVVNITIKLRPMETVCESATPECGGMSRVTWSVMKSVSAKILNGNLVLVRINTTFTKCLWGEHFNWLGLC